MKTVRPLATLALPLSLALTLTPAVHAAQPAAQPDQQGGGTSALYHDDLFNGTEKFSKDASDVTEINQGPDELGMVDGRNRGRAHNTVLSVVRTYSYDKPGMYNIKDVEEFRQKLNTGDWHCSVHTRDMRRGESTDICNRSRTDGMVESAIITVEPKELTFIHTIKRAQPSGDRDSDSNKVFRIIPSVPKAPNPPTPPGPGASVWYGGTVLPGMDVGMLAGLNAEISARLNSDLLARLGYQSFTDLSGLEEGLRPLTQLEMQGPFMEARNAEREAMEPLIEARAAAAQARIEAEQARIVAETEAREAGAPYHAHQFNYLPYVPHALSVVPKDTAPGSKPAPSAAPAPSGKVPPATPQK